jgi:hypothetical protein
VWEDRPINRSIQGVSLRRITVTLVSLGCAALLSAPLASVAFASSTAHAAGYGFAGKTSQNLPLTMLLASSGKKVRLHFQYQVSCDSGLTFPDEEVITVPSHLVGATGHHISRVKFSAEGSDSISTTGPSGQAIAGTLSLIVAGNIRLDTGNAKGTIQPTVTLSNGDKCTSGNTPITYSARVS